MPADDSFIIIYIDSQFYRLIVYFECHFLLLKFASSCI